MNQGLYHQSQRATTANILLILAGATVGFITVDEQLKGPDVYAALFLIVSGFFGIIWSVKYHERYEYYLNRGSSPRVSVISSKADPSFSAP
jgi:TctA family transporter